MSSVSAPSKSTIQSQAVIGAARGAIVGGAAVSASFLVSAFHSCLEHLSRNAGNAPKWPLPGDCQLPAEQGICIEDPIFNSPTTFVVTVIVATTVIGAISATVFSSIRKEEIVVKTDTRI